MCADVRGRRGYAAVGERRYHVDMAAHGSTSGPRSIAHPASVPSCFEAGTHTIRIVKVMEGRWTVAVDDFACPASYATQAEAWEAGVREADRRDREVAAS